MTANDSIIRSILRIILPYVFVAGLWILLSDWLLGLLPLDPQALTQWSIYKGWAFVLVTAALLAILLHAEIHRRLWSQEALHESEVKYRTLFETANDAIMLLKDNRFVDCNARALALFGCSREQLLGTSPHMHSPPSQPDGQPSEVKAIGKINQALNGNAQFFEWLHCRRDGTFFTAEVSLNRLKLNGDILLQSIIRDITERKHAESAIRDLNTRLEQRVAERTAQLAVAKERAEAADRVKSAFLATMSHELRTPLNSIIGFTGILLQGLAGPLNDEQHRQLEMVRESSRHLLALINDVLDISKIEAGQLKVNKSPFDMEASLRKVIAIIKPLAEKKGLSVHLDVASPLGTVWSDAKRVEQILLNLLNNAVKFTDHGNITLAAESNTSMLKFSVTDTGIGIRPDDMASLFQPFRQLDTSLARLHEGTGLGLAICRRLTDLLGGEITVTSTWGEGSRFTVTLPTEGSPS